MVRCSSSAARVRCRPAGKRRPQDAARPNLRRRRGCRSRLSRSRSTDKLPDEKWRFADFGPRCHGLFERGRGDAEPLGAGMAGFGRNKSREPRPTTGDKQTLLPRVAVGSLIKQWTSSSAKVPTAPLKGPLGGHFGIRTSYGWRLCTAIGGKRILFNLGAT